MNITEIIAHATKPELYSKGTAQMWTTPYISKQLLNFHLNPDVDLASRQESTINKTLEWILEHTEEKPLNIIDLGCGPGLYTHKLAEMGNSVTGVDFSENSINYARTKAEQDNLPIQYLQKNYLELELEDNSFDLAIMIFTDFGVLNTSERNILLKSIRRILKPGGMFVFDVLNDTNVEQKLSPKEWNASSQNGFWSPSPYVELSESFLYEEQKVLLKQHIVLHENDSIETYRFWMNFFTQSDLRALLAENGLTVTSFTHALLPQSSIWDGENVTFCKSILNE